jgi:sugar phosphate isomerase/epimerase
VHGSRISTARVGNLVDITTPAQRHSVDADLALTAAIGGETLVYHSGLLRDPYGDDRALAVGLAAERDALRQLGDEAGRHGIRIAVENLDPVMSYIERRAYGLDPLRLVEQVQAVNHPQVGICLDVGHAFLAARYLDFDYLAAVRAVAPWVNHLHISDNLGQVELDPDANAQESLILGDGDLHLPPGWGTAPLADALSIPFSQAPLVILELRQDFIEHAAEALATTRALVAPATAPVAVASSPGS